jgi:uncharacterized protein
MMQQWRTLSIRSAGCHAREVSPDAEGTWVEPDAAAVDRTLRETRTVAIVGASANPARPSYEVYRYLATRSDYELYPVNPTITEIDGRPVYHSLAALPVVPDLVDVFRRHEMLPSVLAETLAMVSGSTSQESGGRHTLWLQLGLWHEQVARDGEAAGLRVVMDRCLKVEHARWIGGQREATGD